MKETDKNEEDAKRRLSFETPSPTSHNKSRTTPHNDISFEHEANDLGVSSIQDLKPDSLGQDMKILQEASSQQQQGVKYTDIRSKFNNLFSKSLDQHQTEEEQSKKVNRTLFRAGSDDDGAKSPLEKDADGLTMKSGLSSVGEDAAVERSQTPNSNK